MGKNKITNHERSVGTIIKDIINSIFIAFIIAVILRVFFIEAFFIPSASMENTLKIGDQILVWKLLYNRNLPVINKKLFFGIKVSRSDIIVFKLKKNEDALIKRVIGIPGDKIELAEKDVVINGKILKEDYVKDKAEVNYGLLKLTVPRNKFFVLGDNRNNSKDSRIFGFVDSNQIIGKAVFIYYPFKHFITF